MGFTGLCRGDELLDALHGYFEANVLRVPEERIQPMTAVARRKRKQAFRGALENLVADGALDDIPVQPSKMAELSGKRSRSVDVDLGLRILSGFLSGFGIPSAGIGTHLKRARGLSFSFADVMRHWVDPGLVGRRLDRASLDPNDSASSLYFGDDPWQLLLVDSVITSNRFTIAVTGDVGQMASIDVPAIHDLIGTANAQVSVQSSVAHEVSFAGPQPLTFAFTLQRVFLEDNGRISMLNPEDMLLGDEDGEGHAVVATPVRLSAQPALIDWDSIDDSASLGQLDRNE